MLSIIGTVPDETFPLAEGIIKTDHNDLCIGQRRIPVTRGTPALIAAAVKTAEYLGNNNIHVCLIGDTGLGHGSRKLYEYLTENITKWGSDTMVFHYLLPDSDWHNRVLFAIDDMPKRPTLIADAGFMYAAKMSGQAGAYDLFTPDAGELAFLADETAPHPFYTKGFLLHEENHAPDLIKRAYKNHNAAKHLLVKGKKDYIADRKGVLKIIENPSIEAMEAIGGTGDMLAGIASGLIESGIDIIKSASTAAYINRLTGEFTNPSPATQVIELIQSIPKSAGKTDLMKTL